jgi:hypothetical protein
MHKPFLFSCAKVFSAALAADCSAIVKDQNVAEEMLKRLLNKNFSLTLMREKIINRWTELPSEMRSRESAA